MTTPMQIYVTVRRSASFGRLGLWALLLLPFASSVGAQQLGKTGQIELLYIRAEWSDGLMALTDAEWESRLGGIHAEADDYWQFHSSSAITGFTSAVTGRLLMAGPAPTPDDPADPGTVRAEMRALAQAAGFVLGDYDHVVLSYPSVAHTFSFGALGTPGTVWMPGSNPWGPGFIHEMGHAFAVGHANHWEGGPDVLPGVPREGRDGLFMMGSEGGGIIGGRSTINMPMRFLMGHTGTGNVGRALESGVVRLHEFELATNPQGKLTAVRVVVDGTSPGDWWLSFAPKMVERWASFGSDGFGRGIIAHQLIGSTTRSIDFTPQSIGGVGTNEEDYIDCRDGALQIGNAFTFPGSDVTIEPLQTGEDNGVRWIEVMIDLGPSSGPLLVREEFDAYQPGNIDGQFGRGLGLTSSRWRQTVGSGQFDLAPGLSGQTGVALDSNGERADLRIAHDIGRWGIGRLWFSLLYRETQTAGHFWASGSASFDGAVGHPWNTRTWAINNTTTPGSMTFGLGETHRLIALLDWDAGTTTLWVDESSSPITDPSLPGFNPVAFKEETPPPNNRELFLSFEAGTEGVMDDIRIGTTFESVVEPGVEFCGAESCPCANSGSRSGCANSVGAGAALRSDGSASVSLDNLELRVEGMPPSTSALIFMGGAGSSVLLGDGVRCVAAGPASLCRFPVRTADSAGQASWTQLVATAAGGGPACTIAAGSTWYFQGWYRDVNGPCGTGFNLSSAQSVLFTP